MRAAIRRLQALLEERASSKSRAWWERYLKGVIPFRGVGIPTIREIVAGWRDPEMPLERQFDLALTLIREPIAEDKLAGVVYLQEHLVGRVPWRNAVPRYAALFDAGHIFDWSTCDWFCVRVLGPTIAAHGLPAARAIAAWRNAENLWRARASIVAFVNLVRDPRFHDLIEKSAAVLIRRDERFAQTAVGWVMGDLGRHDPERVRAFVEKHREHFSTEAFKRATASFRTASQA